MLRERERRFWSFDGIPGDWLATKATVNAEGRIALPHGQTYAVVVVADAEISLAVLRAVERLVNAGATVWLQVAPERSPSHADGRDADREIREIGLRLGAGHAPGLYAIGKGRSLVGADRSGVESIGAGMPARRFFAGLHAAAMDRLGVPAAFAYRPGNPADRLFFRQRRAEGAEIYFVANAGRDPVRAECTFRVAGKRPERWDPVTGRIAPLADFAIDGPATVLPLALAAHESVFVVFREPAAGAPTPPPREPATEIERHTVGGPWRLVFDPARDGLESFEIPTDRLFRWDLSSDERVRAFSGTASYRAPLEWRSVARNPASRLWLDLGASPSLFELTGAGRGTYEIREDAYDALCAEVLVNGRSAGVRWCAPYRIDVTGLLQPGSNELEIRVTNTWHNWRRAHQFTAGNHPWEKNGLRLPPAPAGLLGPITLTAVSETRFEGKH